MKTYYFGSRSLQALSTIHPDLQRLAKEVLKRGIFDFGITCGHRTKGEQDAAFFNGLSKASWPNSKHNSLPSLAFDFVLYINGSPTFKDKDKPGYYIAIGVFRAVAAELGISIRCGGDWDGDMDINDQTLHDLVHIELTSISSADIESKGV